MMELHCIQCGVVQEAACECGVEYVPAIQYAAIAVIRNPEKSDRAIAADIGVSHVTVAKARKATGNNLPVEKRVGLDGKARKLPRLRIVKDEETLAEEYEEDLYISGVFIAKEMKYATRQRYFAHLKEQYQEQTRAWCA